MTTDWVWVGQWQGELFMAPREPPPPKGRRERLAALAFWALSLLKENLL